jgi:endoglucanase
VRRANERAALLWTKRMTGCMACVRTTARRFASCLVVVAVAVIPSGAARSQTERVPLTGVNIAGAEFGHTKLPGRHGTDYFYPDKAAIEAMIERGMNTLRIPFRWERMQRSLYGELDDEEWRRLDEVVTLATAKGAYVILDVHNYASYNRQPIGAPSVPVDALADLWRRLAERSHRNPRVIFGLMNEPKGLPTETWLAAANAAIVAIRKAGAKNLILVPGNGWTGAHSWMSRNYGTPNGEAMLGVVDPADNYAFEVHQYLDADFSGTKPQCRSEAAGVKALTIFANWARQHGKRGFLGEFGAGPDPVCLAALEAMLRLMADNRDVWLGWTYWAAGPWPRSYFTSVQPLDGRDSPQMELLMKHAAGIPGTVRAP